MRVQCCNIQYNVKMSFDEINILNSSSNITVQGKMTIDYLLPLIKPLTRQVADILYLKKKCTVESRG